MRELYGSDADAILNGNGVRMVRAAFSQRAA